MGMPSQMMPQQYNPSMFGQFLQAGSSIDPETAAALASALSSIDFKTDVSEVGHPDEDLMADAMLQTPVFEYRYKFEGPDKRHLGMIVEESPEEVTMFDKTVGLYEYIGTLHATIKSLNRRLSKLEVK